MNNNKTLTPEERARYEEHKKFLKDNIKSQEDFDRVMRIVEHMDRAVEMQKHTGPLWKN